MSYIGSWKIDDYLTFCCNTHDPDTGVATDADSAPAYRVYEDDTGTAILTGTMDKLDDANTTGFYEQKIQLTAANGFEKGKMYHIYISATVDSDTGTMAHCFQIEAEVDANAVSASNVSANIAQIGGTTVPQTSGKLHVLDDEGNTIANESKQDTIDTVVDGIQTDLDNATDGLGALKALIDTLDGVADAIKAITDNLPDSGALSTINGYVDILDDATNGLVAIKAEVEGLGGVAMRGTDNAATEAKQDTIDTVVDGIQTDLDNATDGLGALKALIDTVDGVVDSIKSKTDNLPTDPADDSDIDSQLVANKAILDKLDSAMEADGAVHRFTENALEEAPTGSAPTAAAVADAVWDEDLNDHKTADTAGSLQAFLGKWEIIGTQLKLYALDDTTVLYTFDLTNASGAPSAFRVWKREPA